MKVREGDIFLYNKGNPYHEWIILNYAKKKGYSMRDVVVTKKYKELHWLRYPYRSVGGEGKYEVVKLIFDKDCKGILRTTRLLNKKRRIYFITTASKDEYVDILKNGNTIKKFPRTKTYDEKFQLLENIVNGWKGEYETKKVKTYLIRQMIKNEDTWESALFLIEMIKSQGKKVTVKDVEELYEEDSFYNLDTWIYDVLKGAKPRKTVQSLYYFIEERNYSIRWLIEKMREKYVKLSFAYQLYRRGVFNTVISPLKLKERFDRGNIFEGEFKGELESFINDWEENFSYSEQRNLLDYIDNVSYQKFHEISKIVFNRLDLEKVSLGSEAVLYEMIEEIRNVFKDS